MKPKRLRKMNLYKEKSFSEFVSLLLFGVKLQGKLKYKMSRALLLASLVLMCCGLLADASILRSKSKRDDKHALSLPDDELQPCLCGVFMSGQLNRTTRARSRAPPRGEPVMEYEADDAYQPCGSNGYRLCLNKCLDEIMKHLSKASSLICGSLERDCHREKAYLYIQNCSPKWTSTNLSAGKEFCCRDGESLKCNEWDKHVKSKNSTVF